VAQLGARFHGMEEVIGSIPIRSTNKSTAYGLPSFQLGVKFERHSQRPHASLTASQSKQQSQDLFSVLFAMFFQRPTSAIPD
jgi:hypothetical protein